MFQRRLGMVTRDQYQPLSAGKPNGLKGCSTSNGNPASPRLIPDPGVTYPIGFGKQRDPIGDFWHQVVVKKLTATQIKSKLARLPEWKKTGSTISRTFVFKNFPAAVRFVNIVAKLAETAWHHPDIDIRWNKVTLILTTHDAGGLTQKDFSLGQKFDQAAHS